MSNSALRRTRREDKDFGLQRLRAA